MLHKGITWFQPLVYYSSFSNTELRTFGMHLGGLEMSSQQQQQQQQPA